MRDDSVYVEHILDAIRQIEAYTSEFTFEDFLADRLVQDGVARQLEIIGEATKQLSNERKSRHPHIQWTDIAGMRDKLIHQYFGIDLEVVWDTIKRHVPELKNALVEG